MYGITVRSEGEGTVVVCVRGDLDAATSPELERAVETLCSEADVVLLDLSGVTFADVTGYRTLLLLCITPYGCNDVRVAASSPAISRVAEAALADALPASAERA